MGLLWLWILLNWWKGLVSRMGCFKVYCFSDFLWNWFFLWSVLFFLVCFCSCVIWICGDIVWWMVFICCGSWFCVCVGRNWCCWMWWWGFYWDCLFCDRCLCGLWGRLLLLYWLCCVVLCGRSSWVCGVVGVCGCGWWVCLCWGIYWCVGLYCWGRVVWYLWYLCCFVVWLIWVCLVSLVWWFWCCCLVDIWN